jgi:flagellar hook-associated protein 1 FlgK
MALNTALAIAGRSLEIFQTGIHVAGQNIANASTPNYIREELTFEAGLSYRQGSILLGTGVLAAGVQQQIDLFLESRIHSSNADASASQAREAIFQQLENEIRELGDNDLSSAINDFLAAINEAINQPESSSFRHLAVAEGVQLAADIATLRNRVDGLREAQTINIDSLVHEANSLIDSIYALNPQIMKLESGGLIQSDAGGLRSQRYAALNRLSEIIPIRYEENPDGGVAVFLGSDPLILAGTYQHLETVSDIDRGVNVQQVRLSKSQAPVTTTSGELGGIMQGRDEVLGGFVDQLDKYAQSLISEFNRIHASGEGLKGFTSLTAATTVSNPTTALNAAGLAFTPRHGSFDLKVTDPLTGLTETTTIDVDLDGIGSDTTLQTLRNSLDAVANLTATITTDGRLQITAAPGHEFRFSNDTSGALASLGLNTFFTGSNSTDIAVSAVVNGDHAYFATGRGGGPADNSNALALVEFINAPIEALGGSNLDNFYTNTISALANTAATESALADGFATFRDSLLNQRSQFSGVSLDEEAIRILEYQHAFQAAARLISTIDELFTTLITM